MLVALGDSLKNPCSMLPAAGQCLPGVRMGDREARLAVCGAASWQALCEFLQVSHLQLSTLSAAF